MTILLAFCAGLSTAAIVAVAVYLILTLKQLERSARALEQLLRHLDESAIHINDTTRLTSSLVQGFAQAASNTHPLVKGIIWGIKNFFTSRQNGQETQTKEQEYNERKK